MSASRILTGHTRVVGVIGHPVEHSLSPPMHNGEFERLGLDYVYVPFPIAPEQLETGVRGLIACGLAGFNATIPHKQGVMTLLNEITPDAELIGAVNTVVIRDGRSTGYNTDVQGWLDDIQQDILLKGNRICMLGAGGAARALVVGAAQAGARSICITNRTQATAAKPAAEMQGHFPGVEITANCIDGDAAREALEKCEIIVNATSVGMARQPGTAVPTEWLHEGQYVYDTIYTPAETELLKGAARRGCPTRGGLGMLARQGALAFKLWTGQTPDLERMEATLRRALAQG